MKVKIFSSIISLPEKSKRFLNFTLFGKSIKIKGKDQLDLFVKPQADKPVPGQTKQFGEDDLRQLDPIKHRWIDADKKQERKESEAGSQEPVNGNKKDTRNPKFRGEKFDVPTFGIANNPDFKLPEDKSDVETLEQDKEYSKSYIDTDGKIINYELASEKGIFPGFDNNERVFKKLNKEEGEFCAVERQYKEYKQIEFISGRTKVENTHDIAYLFKQLEGESVEHAFCAYLTEDNLPIVQHISTGDFASSIIEPKLMVDVVERIKPKTMYFIHNHPSGNIEASPEDMIVLKRLQKIFPNLNIIGIIIDRKDCKYGLFGKGDYTDKMEILDFTKYDKTIPLKAISFSKQVLFSDVVLGEKVTEPEVIAKFITASKFSSGKKNQVFTLQTDNRISGRFTLTNNLSDIESVSKEIALFTVRSGGYSAIIAGNSTFDTDLKNSLLKIQGKLKELNISLLDYLVLEKNAKTGEPYKSAVYEHVLEKKVEYKPKSEIERLKEKENATSSN